MKYLWPVIAVIAAFGSGWLCCKSCTGHHPDAPVLPQDTVFVHDTIVDVLPSPSDTKMLEDSIAVLLARLGEKPDTVVRDSAVYVYLPREQRRYTAPTYDAWVSGVAPRLDSIHTFSTKEIIHVPYPVETPARDKMWRVAVEGGAIAGTQQFFPYIEGGVERYYGNMSVKMAVGYGQQMYGRLSLSYGFRF